MVVPASRLTMLFSVFAFILPITSLLAPKGVVPVLMVTAALAGLILWRSKRRLPLPDRPIALALGFLVIWCGIASLWSFEAATSLILTARIGAIFIAGLILFAIAGELDDVVRERIGRWLLVGVLATLAIMVVELAFDYPLIKLVNKPDPNRDWATRLNRGATAMAMLVWPAAAFLWRLARQRLAVLLLLLTAAILYLLESSAANVALAAAAVTVSIAAVHHKAGRTMLIGLVLAALVGSPFVAKQLYAQGLYRADWLPASAQHRVEIWNFAVQRLMEKPFVGWGFDASRHFGRLQDQSAETDRWLMPLHPHNGALQILLELGVVGGLLAFALLWFLAARLEDFPAPCRTFGQGLFVAALTVACLSYGMWQNQWLAMMISAALLIPLTAVGAGERRT